MLFIILLLYVCNDLTLTPHANLPVVTAWLAQNSYCCVSIDTLCLKSLLIIGKLLALSILWVLWTFFILVAFGSWAITSGWALLATLSDPDNGNIKQEQELGFDEKSDKIYAKADNDNKWSALSYWFSRLA